MSKTKILLDTDIGSDIDDALCLTYLLSQPYCELMGITTVSGQADRRAALADYICTEAGFSIPIFPGATEPLSGIQRQPVAQLTQVVDRYNSRAVFSHGKAIDFMQKTIRDNPGEITLLCIGPLTNVALLFTLYPDIPKLLKQLVMMCGVFHYKLPGLENFDCEWNASVDPVATAIVYGTDVPIHRSVGLDVTCQLVVEKAALKNYFDTPIFFPVKHLLENFTYHESVFFHDPLAAVSVFDNTVCTFDSGLVTVLNSRHDSPGKTVWTPYNSAAHEVATDVNCLAFFSHYFETIQSIC